MAKQKSARQSREQGMLDNIGGRDEPSPEPAAPSAAAPSAATSVGWMGYVGSVLWATLFFGTGLAAWLFFTRGG